MTLTRMILAIVGPLTEWMSTVRSTVSEKNRACFIYLRIGHISKSCPDKKGCEHCSNMHHSTLHQEPMNKVNNCLQLVNGEQSGETVVLMVSEVRC